MISGHTFKRKEYVKPVGQAIILLSSVSRLWSRDSDHSMGSTGVHVLLHFGHSTAAHLPRQHRSDAGLPISPHLYEHLLLSLLPRRLDSASQRTPSAAHPAAGRPASAHGVAG